MYKSFFGLTRNPFEISPDPAFFYPTARHNEALANLYYGIRRQKGFVVVTGEVGTGKTLLIRCLLETLQKSQVAFAYVFNPRLDEVQFLQYVMGDLGLPHTGRNKTEMLLALNSFLIQRHRNRLPTALIVDEAQQLNSEVLEEIRLLTNLETAQQKLLQIVLVGQPELDHKLDSVELRQLKQRVALRCRLEPLTPQEIPNYVQRRLELAGAKGRAGTLFPSETLDAVYEYSLGIPRLINTICENALLSAYAVQSQSVTPAMIAEVAADFRLQVTTAPSQNGNRSSNDRTAALKALIELLHSAEKETELLETVYPAEPELPRFAMKKGTYKR